ncbi:MAG: class I SAM-dependent methyltransferase [Methanomicrobiales archaeon]
MIEDENVDNLAYGGLAWTETILDTEKMYEDETMALINFINKYSKIKLKSVLHLGCGAGGNDYTLKRYFKVTGVDISSDMLEIARTRNPEVEYNLGDMRSIILKNKFDAVVIPDSIGYMTSSSDLEMALKTAYNHLRPGGVLFINTPVKEEFKENNFVYTGSKKDVKLTIFENNYIPHESVNIYEATLIFLIRIKGKLEVYQDTHILGIFESKTWNNLLEKVGFKGIEDFNIQDLYQEYLLGEGNYPLKIFMATKD